MTVTNTSYTTNSYKVTVVNEVTFTNIIAGINTAILACASGAWATGGTYYDFVDRTTYSPIQTYVYRAINADTSTYKYFIIRYDTINCRFFTSTCESWNTTTNVATNESWSGGGAFPQYYDLKDCFIFVSATARHICIWPFIKNEPGMWSSVMEFERVAYEDTAGAGFPCWAWTNSVMIGTAWGRELNTTASATMFAFPRTGDGATGAAAAKLYAPVTNRGMFPPNYPNYLSNSLVVTADPNLLHLASFYNITYGWDGSKTIVSPISADAISKSMPVGRAYNFSVTKPIGSFLDTTLINIDSTGGWADSAGSSTECVLLPMNGGCEADAAYAAGKMAITTNTITTANYPAKGIAIGDIVWYAETGGVRTWSMNTGAGAGATTLYGSAGTVVVAGLTAVTDIIFDGERTLYAATSTGIHKIDTETPSTATSITIGTGGIAYLSMDARFIYATERTAATGCRVFMIDRAAFSSGAAATYTIATTLPVVATGFGVPVPDYNGVCYVATQAGTTGITQTMRIASFTAATGAQLFNVVNPLRTAAGTDMSTSPTSFYYDYLGSRIYLFVANVGATAAAIYELNTSLVATTTIASVTSSATVGSTLSHMTTASATMDYRGDLNIVPIRGIFYVSAKKVAQPFASPGGFVTRVQFNSPQTATAGQPTTGTSFATATTGIGTNPQAAGSVVTTNGARIIASFTTTAASSNQLSYINGVYNVTTVAGAAAGRLLMRG
jgi:hypothetical protein